MSHIINGRRNETLPETTNRRSSYRIGTDNTHDMISAQAMLESGQHVELQVVNFSYTGLLFYTQPTQALKMNVYLPNIRLEFRNKPAIDLAGKIVRVTESEDRLFCGVHFQLQNTPPVKTVKHNLIDEIIRTKWEQKLRAIPDYLSDNQDQIEQQLQQQGLAYKSFDSRVASFSVEERWWFFEMLDELKRQEPDFHTQLLDEFIYICEFGFPLPKEKPPAQADGIMQHVIRWLKNQTA